MAKRRVNVVLSTADVMTKEGLRPMLTKKFDVSKTIENDLVGKVQRKADVTIALPENLEEATALFGDDLYKWARHGYLAHAKITASTSLLGVLGNKDSRKLVRQFGESLRTLVDVMGMEKQAAIETILKNEKFVSLREAVEQQTSGTATKVLDYTTTPLPTPKWFETANSEDEDENDNDSE